MLPDDNASSAARALAAWFRTAQRKLPWREHYDPYRVWLSEVMLQQTQVATVLPYYDKFLTKFPTVQSLAAADEDAVFALWAGLGYYSRARNLLRGARAVVAEHGGKFPSTAPDLRSIPGIGPYTAGAVASIAFNSPAPIVDGNVARVFGRIYMLPTPPKASSSQATLWKLAEQWVTAGAEPRDVNQGLMELGATVCTRANPRCGACPVQTFCGAYRENRVAEFPVPDARKKYVELRWFSAVIEDPTGKRLYVGPADRGRWWHGLRDFPREELTHHSAATVAQRLAKKIGAVEFEPLGTVKHTVTHHRILVEPFRFRLAKDADGSLPPGEWLAKDALAHARLSGLAAKIAERRATMER